MVAVVSLMMSCVGLVSIPSGVISGMPDGSFRFEADGSLPPRAWCSILTNGRFSFIANESFTGNMWYKNAREYSINRRVRGVRDTRGSETLELCQSSGRASLFATPDGDGCTVSYGFGFAQWEKTAESYIPPPPMFPKAPTRA